MSKTKNIYCVRHAKSSWADIRQADIDRPLNARGLRDAPLMGAKLSLWVKQVDHLLISPSRRTQMTSEAIEPYFTVTKKEEVNRLYHASLGTLLDVITSLDEACFIAVIIAHNPGMHMLYDHFGGDTLSKFPTCAVFQLESTADDWHDVDTTNTFVKRYMYPKMFN